MNSPVLDQDNVFAEPASAFDGATPAPASRGRAKTVKKSGGIPIWLWATSGVVVLLVTFVVFRMISGQRESNHLEPITQAPAANRRGVVPTSRVKWRCRCDWSWKPTAAATSAAARATTARTTCSIMVRSILSLPPPDCFQLEHIEITRQPV